MVAVTTGHVAATATALADLINTAIGAALFGTVDISYSVVLLPEGKEYSAIVSIIPAS